MAYSVGFGTGGSPQQWYLPGSNTAGLPWPPGGETAPVAGAIRQAVTGLAGEGQVFGGTVAYTAGLTNGHPELLLDVQGAWNSVKNLAVIADTAASLRLLGFVHVDVTTAGPDPAVVGIEGAKRGNVSTGGGDDIVSVAALTNEAQWSNEVRITTGAGTDTVETSSFDPVAAAAAGDATFAATTGGAGGFAPDNASTRIFVDGGAGDDLIRSTGLSRDSLEGGSGADRIEAGGGDDWIFGGPGSDLLSGGAGNDVLFGDEGSDTLQGGTGNDDLVGGSGGTDIFVFDASPAGGGFGHDRMTGFRGVALGGDDQLRFLGYTEADLARPVEAGISEIWWPAWYWQFEFKDGSTLFVSLDDGGDGSAAGSAPVAGQDYVFV